MDKATFLRKAGKSLLKLGFIGFSALVILTVSIPLQSILSLYHVLFFLARQFFRSVFEVAVLVTLPLTAMVAVKALYAH